MSLDITALAAGNPSVQIEFRLDSDGGVNFGGWTIDDFSIVSVGPGSTNCPGPSIYCTAKLLSTGNVASAGWTGTSSFAANDLHLTCTNGVPNKTGVPYYSNTAAGIPFMGGFLCAQPPVQRGAPFAFDAVGFIDVPWPITAGMVGTSEFIGFWFRDPQNSDGTFVGLSDAVQVNYCP
jgi:hypothetical protein